MKAIQTNYKEGILTIAFSFASFLNTISYLTDEFVRFIALGLESYIAAFSLFFIVCALFVFIVICPYVWYFRKTKNKTKQKIVGLAFFLFFVGAGVGYFEYQKKGDSVSRKSINQVKLLNKNIKKVTD